MTQADIELALACHRAGRWTDAETLYRRILEREPEHLDALSLLGACLAQSGRPAEAIPLLQRAAERRPDLANLANLGNALHATGRPEEALRRIDRALLLDDRVAELHVNRANVLRDLGRYDAALAACARAAARVPAHAAAWIARGEIEQEMGANADALASFDRALAADPRSVGACYNRGVSLLALERFEEARAAFVQAIGLQGDHARAWGNLGIALNALERKTEALAAYDHALALQDDLTAARVSRGHLLQDLGERARALGDYDRALKLGQSDAGLYLARGDALRLLGRLSDAIESYGRGLVLDPDHTQAAAAHLNQAICHLSLGEWEPGWREFEWRWGDARLHPPHAFGLERLWLGETPIAGKTLLVHAEQGYGDSLQMCRFLPALAQQAARILLAVPPALRPLLAGLDECVRLIESDAIPDFDCHVPMMSLPIALHLTAAALPGPTPYLRAPEDRRCAWRDRLGPRRAPRIGVAWSGNPAHPHDAQRSLPLATLARLLRSPAGGRFEWIAIQRERTAGDAALMRELPLRWLGDELRDFADAAAVLECVDHVLSVDTAAAHLAGALGRPASVLLADPPDWRWMLGREDSPWYPKTRLFRQRRPGDWDEVLDRVAAYLRALEVAP